MKKLLCILLMLLFAIPAFAQENHFAPFEIHTPEGVILESNDGSHTFVLDKIRVVALLISRIPDADPDRSILRLMSQFDADAMLEEDLPMAEGYVGITSRSENRFGDGVDQISVLILGPSGDLLILSGYDMDGDEAKVQSLLEALLSQLSVNHEPIILQE